MGTTNYGNQRKSFDYKAQGKASVFNIINYKIQPEGIYEGFNISRVDDTTVSISPGVCFITDPNVDGQGIGLRVSTIDAQQLSVNATNIYIVLRMSWSDSLNANYMDMLAIPSASIQPNDLIVGRCVYSGSTLTTAFDLSRKSWSTTARAKESLDKLIITPLEPYQNAVNISAGYYTINDKVEFYAGGSLGSIPEVINNMISYIVINASGVVSLINSDDAVTPTKPDIPNNVYVIGYLTRGTNTVVLGSSITNLAKEPSSANLNTVIDTLETDVDDIKAGTLTTELQEAIFDMVHPVGEVYVQYPYQSSPSTMYSIGTWTDISNTQLRNSSDQLLWYNNTTGVIQTSSSEASALTYRDCFFRVEGSISTSTAGQTGATVFGYARQLDQMQRITGRAAPRSILGFFQDSDGGFTTGAFSLGADTYANFPSGSTGTGKSLSFNSADSPSARVSSVTTGETRSVNMSIKIWKRTA